MLTDVDPPPFRNQGRVTSDSQVGLKELQVHIYLLQIDKQSAAILMYCDGAAWTFCCSTNQAKTQDCYANLSLKPPAMQSGRSSPQIQYSDVVHLDMTAQPAREVEEVEEGGDREEADSTDVMSTVSDLYACVQTQRTKTIDPAVDEEAYANQF